MEFEKYHKIKIVGDEDNKGIFDDPDDVIIIEEKMDGGNFRFMSSDKGLIMGSRTRELDEDNPNSKSFKRCMEFVKDNVSKGILTGGKFIFYGECMIKHTMSYDWENIPPFLGFDIKNMETNEYLNYNKKVEMFTEMRLPIVPLIKKCKAGDIKKFTDDDVPNTKYPEPSANDLQAEGIVIKNYKKNLFAKYVRDKFKEKAKETFGNSKKFARAEGDDSLIVATYCTNARIDKIIFKLIDDGYKLEMKLMEQLPKAVINDIYEEHWKEICFSNWSVNFRQIRKKVTKRCLTVLQQVIVNNSLKYHSFE